jgi:polyphosphate kinase 2 (PPK2 family)
MRNITHFFNILKFTQKNNKKKHSIASLHRWKISTADINSLTIHIKYYRAVWVMLFYIKQVM